MDSREIRQRLIERYGEESLYRDYGLRKLCMMLTQSTMSVRIMVARVCGILLETDNHGALRHVFHDGRLNINNAGEQNISIIRENLIRQKVFHEGDFQ